jgi:uncharacterized protein YbjT (DUF2867 family)
MILVTGATGKTGSDVARGLRALGKPVRTIARNAEKAQSLVKLGVEVVTGDGTDLAILRNALNDVEQVVMIYPNGPAQLGLEKGLVDAARVAGIDRIVKLSSMEALAHMTNPVHQTHYQSEQHIKASGIAWTMIRPNFYMQNFFGNAFTIKSEGKFYLPMGKGRAVMTDTRDVAAATVHVLTTPGHANQTYEITGPTLMSFADVAADFAKVLGKPVEYVDQDPAAYKAHLGKFLSSTWHLDAVCDIFKEIREGYITEPVDTFKRLLGREPTTFQQFVSDHRGLFSA